MKIPGDNQGIYELREFFNAVTDSYFVQMVEDFAKGYGVGIDCYYLCSFPDDLDFDEEPFDGVKVFAVDSEVVVDYETFYQYLKMACETYISRHPEDKNKINELLKKCKARWGI
jgi:hypothetical protein